MPELPEVETVRRGLEPVLAGATIARVVQRRPDLRFPLPERFAERLSGRRLERLERRAKYILGHLDSGEVLTIHLGMTGRFSIAVPGGANGTQLGELTHDAGGDPAHDHVVIETAAGATVTYNDARRFGYMSLIPAAELDRHPHFRSLGVEPLGPALTPAYLATRAEGRTADLKAFLMDQRIVAGLGNIYVCEALWRAGLSPNRTASALARRGARPTERGERLVVAIRAVLEAAILAGGSTLRDYRHTDGSLGYFQHSFAVYGREGEPCTTPGCGGTVRRNVQAGRSTFWCGGCQR
ncbi:MAG: bifunctional DNA-formamidopyrimidine glycosylase/DNA-(apurinic or apyrimidinic site) lyase [Hyphomicrobiaceae bacterium]|nr:bifunctional DNA-formamidopyrimidine glycosylase/DNA-(apurinic or apyrimidinic site) lyase [Hyphomicrobiaceae bacterium]